MVALGAGIGVDYGIYLLSRMQEYLAGRRQRARRLSTRPCGVTGASIIFTGITLAIGVVTWVFSPLQFQADIGDHAHIHVLREHARRDHPAARAGRMVREGKVA